MSHGPPEAAGDRAGWQVRSKAAGGGTRGKLCLTVYLVLCFLFTANIYTCSFIHALADTRPKALPPSSSHRRRRQRRGVACGAQIWVRKRRSCRARTPSARRRPRAPLPVLPRGANASSRSGEGSAEGTRARTHTHTQLTANTARHHGRENVGARASACIY